MKKLFICIIIALILFASCSLDKPGIYQSYTWKEDLNYFIDSNPDTPETVYRGEYFAVASGVYEMIYRVASSGTVWYLNYEIYEDNPGHNDSTYFVISLLESGPRISRRVVVSKSLMDKSISAPQCIAKSKSYNDNLEMIGKKKTIIGIENENIDGYCIKIEYGTLE